MNLQILRASYHAITHVHKVINMHTGGKVGRKLYANFVYHLFHM